MSDGSLSATQKFEQALRIGRPPNVVKLFPNSRALLVSGKVVDRAMLAKGNAMCIAANARNRFIIHGALRAAERADAALIIEIAKSEGGADAYCAVDYWNMATYIDAVANQLGVTVPIAVHADHYAQKNPTDVARSMAEIPTMFDAGITSIAIDASHMPDADNLAATVALNAVVPTWAGLETEVGEIKGDQGLSTADEALFLIQGLNAHNVFPDWIALNNGTSHGIQASAAGIQVELTAEIHRVLEPYGVSGAQHGTSGNSFERLRSIVQQTRTTKANVATALQMVSWGVKVNEYGNAFQDDSGAFVREQQSGASDALWTKMVAYAAERGWSAGDYKKLNLPFEGKLWAQPREFRERMVTAVEEFVYRLLTEVFNATGTGSLGVDAILAAGSHDLGPKAQRIEDPAEWSSEKAAARAATLFKEDAPEGNFDD
ncbi:MAG TPA: class II fructose-bisphosphate aldolase [Deferrisomatales bacterium]|nr:class II fructose-bisphosphate aldolase [Deferrisomatales bacterium]